MKFTYLDLVAWTSFIGLGCAAVAWRWGTVGTGLAIAAYASVLYKFWTDGIKLLYYSGLGVIAALLISIEPSNGNTFTLYRCLLFALVGAGICLIVHRTWTSGTAVIAGVFLIHIVQIFWIRSFFAPGYCGSLF